MNVMSGFGFSHVLKTFLPGFVALAALCVLSGVALDWAGDINLLVWLAEADSLLLTFLAISGSVLMGVLLNVFIYMCVLDPLVRRPVERSHSDFFNRRNSLFALLKTWISGTMFGSQVMKDLGPEVDYQYLLAALTPTEKVVFLMDRYWLYLEFQLNFMVAIVLFYASGVLALGHCFSTLGIDEQRLFLLVVLAGCAVAMAAGLSLVASRRNYLRHSQKMVNLLVGVSLSAQREVLETRTSVTDLI